MQRSVHLCVCVCVCVCVDVYKRQVYVSQNKQKKGKEGALRSHSWTLSILQRVHSLKTKSLSMNRSSVNTCSYTAQRSTGSKLMSIFSACTRYAVSYTHLDVYKRQLYIYICAYISMYFYKCVNESIY